MIWFNPSEIRYKITPSQGLIGTRGGDWDIERRVALAETAKYRSVVAHFQHGVPWVETDLFQDAYFRRLQGGPIRGAKTLPDLAKKYEEQIDSLFETLRARGFAATGGLPRLLQGRAGDLFIGNQGNHRLAMAHVLGLKSFAGEIVCRHR